MGLLNFNRFLDIDLEIVSKKPFRIYDTKTGIFWDLRYNTGKRTMFTIPLVSH